MKTPPESWQGSFGDQLGVRYQETSSGHSVAELEVQPRHRNPTGICHGGAIFTLADDTMGAAMHPLCPPGTIPISTQLNIHYARSARQGDTLRAETKVLAQGRRTAVLETRVSDLSGRLVALVTASYLIVEVSS